MDKTAPIVSTYIHVPKDAKISYNIDSSNFGVSASIRIGEHGENDATMFFRNPEQLEKLVNEAITAANRMREAIELRKKLDGEQT